MSLYVESVEIDFICLACLVIVGRKLLRVEFFALIYDIIMMMFFANNFKILIRCLLSHFEVDGFP